jgi:hypothetical protein
VFFFGKILQLGENFPQNEKKKKKKKEKNININK